MIVCAIDFDLDTLLTLLGWMGAGGLLIAYLLLSIGKFDSKSFWYHGLNFICSLFLLLNAWFAETYPFVLVNAFWIVISIIAIVRNARKKTAGND